MSQVCAASQSTIACWIVRQGAELLRQLFESEPVVATQKKTGSEVAYALTVKSR
jgi:hypothetical protein